MANYFRQTGLFAVLALLINFVANAELADTVEKIKPSVVGIGIHTPTGRPQNRLNGTGFVVGNGQYVVTNYHVVPKELDVNLLQQMAVFVGTGKASKVRKARLVGTSAKYDLALLKIEGSPLPAVKLAGDAFLREGSHVAFTGFPIGAVLGLYPVTHRGIIASITPTIIPVENAGSINIAMLKRLRDPYLVYQLDATAYPGNSGSALYNIKTGEVVGVINKVFVQQTKEAVITNPSGITYAIPIKHLFELLKENNVKW
ncbi:S1 family peptidase [Thalassotalea piscium]